jgi:hypothetical protein
MNPVGTSMTVVSRPAGVFSATSNRSTMTTLRLVRLVSCHFLVGIIENRSLAGQPHGSCRIAARDRRDERDGRERRDPKFEVQGSKF